MTVATWVLLLLVTAGSAVAQTPGTADAPPKTAQSDVTVDKKPATPAPPAPAAKPVTAPATPGGDSFSGIEEMIVVGSEVVDSLAPTSTSVTSFDALEIESLGISDISKLAAYTPNLEIRTASSTTATFFIRGVGLNDFTANAASAVAVYVDDAPRNLPAIQLGLLYDLQNVEVQKGPQGSGPGRNASAGAIRITTKKPTGEYNSYFKVDYGNYNLIDMEGGVEVPVIEDVLAMRTAFRVKTRDGIVTNRCGGLRPDQIHLGGTCGEQSDTVIRPGLEKNLNNTDTWSTRTTFRYLPPVEDMEWNLVAHVDRVDQLGTVGQQIGTQGFLGAPDGKGYRPQEITNEFNKYLASVDFSPCNALPPRLRQACRAQLTQPVNNRLAKSLAGRPLDKLPFEGDYNTPGYERQTAGGATLSGDWQVGGITLKNITGFERYDRERLIDADYSPNQTFEFHITDDAWQITEDLRASGELESMPLRWQTGAFYLQEELDYDQNTLATGKPIEPVHQVYVQKTKSLGAFLDLSYDLLDDLTLDAGVRYNWEYKSFAAGITKGDPPRDQCAPDPFVAKKPCQRTETVDQPTGTIALTYRFDELREAYFKFNHGWKGLQYNARDGSRAAEVTDVANPEKIDAFEFGFKGNWLEDRISIDGALFWYAYQNYQVFTFSNDPATPPVRIVINADDAQNFGAELTTTLKPIEGLTADVRFGWLETRFLNFTNSVVRSVPNGNGNEQYRLVFDYNNNQLPNAPRFKVSAGLEYAISLNRYGTLTPRYDLAWTDEVNFDPSGGRGAPDGSGNISLPNHTIAQKAFALHSVSMRYSLPGEKLELAVWARNITNEVYKTLAFDASGGPGFVGNLVGDPRTYGLTVKLIY